MNVQKKIVEGVKELLHEQEYVVLPGFGGFVTQVHFSRYLVEKNILTPPGKIISFNKQLRQNDGVLMLWLQNELQINAETALTHITEFSDYCQQVLKAKRRLTLDDLGFFYLDLEGNIGFEPKNDTNLLLDSFGLSPVILNELSKEDIVQEPEKVAEFIDRTAEITTKAELPVKRKRNFKPLAYIALGGSILFFTLSALITINKNEGPLLSGIFNSGTASTYKKADYSELTLMPVENEIKPYITNANGYAVVELNSKTLAVNVNSTSSNETKNSTSNSSHHNIKGRFQIVLGCFSLKDNAQKMVQKLKKDNISASITGVNNKGMHVVSCAGFNSKDEAQTYLSEIKSNFPTAWIKSDN